MTKEQIDAFDAFLKEKNKYIPFYDTLMKCPIETAFSRRESYLPRVTSVLALSFGFFQGRCLEESRKPGTKVVMLIPARTDTSYFHDYIYPYADLRFIRGRLHYNDSKQGAPFPSMIVVFR